MKRAIIFITLLQALFCFSQPPFNTGLNFPFRSPDAASVDYVLQLLNEMGAPAIQQLTFTDIYWKQVEPTDNNWNFIYPDTVFLNSYGLYPIGQFFAIMGAEDTIGIQIPWEACSNPMTCYWDPATDSAETKDYITTVVQRYMSRTKYWELTNEFEDRVPPKGLVLIQKRDFLQYCYNWVKQADPQARVIFPGLVGTYGISMDHRNEWLREFLNIGGGSTFDILNYHDYNSWWTLPCHFDSIKNILTDYGYGDVPIWVTETSISSSNNSIITPDYATPDEQAADVWRRIGLLWAKGVQAVFWHSFWSSNDMDGWGEFGLVDYLGKKKKSFYSYKLMIEKVADFDSISLLQYGDITDDNDNGGNGLWAIEFTISGEKKWLIWSPDNQSFSLNSIGAPQIIVTHVVPTTLVLNGDSAIFQIDTLATTGGNYVFNDLNSLPVLVEPYHSANKVTNDYIVSSRIFPNPAEKIVTITGLQKDWENIQVVNLIGNDCTCLVTKRNETKSSCLIDIHNLNPGLYFIKTGNKTHILYKK